MSRIEIRIIRCTGCRFRRQLFQWGNERQRLRLSGSADSRLALRSKYTTHTRNRDEQRSSLETFRSLEVA